jgi:hypothetical protein
MKMKARAGGQGGVSFADVFRSMPDGKLYKAYRGHLEKLAVRFGKEAHELENEIFHGLLPELGEYRDGKPVRRAIDRKFANVDHLLNTTTLMLRRMKSREYKRLSRVVDLSAVTGYLPAEPLGCVEVAEADEALASKRRFLEHIAGGTSRRRVVRLAELLLEELAAGRQPKQSELAERLGVDQSTVSRAYDSLRARYTRWCDGSPERS